MQSTLKVQKSGGYEYLYIYFKQKKSRILINTMYKPEKGRMTSENLFKTNEYVNSLILRQKNAVDEYINHCRRHRREVSQHDCSLYLHKLNFANIHLSSSKVANEKSILQHFKDFVVFKTKELSHYNSIRVYNSIYTNLKEFDKFYPLTFQSVNTQQFFPEFKQFSIEKLNHIDNTISKNVAIIKAFLKYLQDEDIFLFKSKILSFKVPKSPPQVISLTTKEITEIYLFKLYNEFERKVIDVFVFLCMTSLRYSDYLELAGKEIEGEIIEKNNIKTKTEMTIPLNDTALEILGNYGNRIPKYTNAYLNRELKVIFAKYNLLQTNIEVTTYQNGRPQSIIGKKAEFITVHKSRASFITNLIANNTPLNEIMTATGHKKVSTLNTYTQKRTNVGLTKSLALNTVKGN